MTRSHKARSDADDEKFALLCCYCARDVAYRCGAEAPHGVCGRRLCEVHATRFGDGPPLCLEHVS